MYPRYGKHKNRAGHMQFVHWIESEKKAFMLTYFGGASLGVHAFCFGYGQYYRVSM